MAIIPLPTRPTLLPEVKEDPRIERVTRAGDGGPLGPQKAKAKAKAKGDCECDPKARLTDVTLDLDGKVRAYLKTHFNPITPLGPPPGDRQLLAEAGVDLAQFMTYPPGISPMGRSALITPLVEPFRSPRSPEVLRALSNQLSLAQAVPKGITSLSTLFGRKASGESKGDKQSKGDNKSKPGPSVPPSAWAAYADGVAATTVANVFPPPLGRADDNNTLPAIKVCRCDPPSSRSAKKLGGG